MLQNSKMLKVRLGEPVLARQGSMVAFQGQVDFDHEGAGGVGKFLKKSVTGEGVQLMRCTGQGEVFFASEADQVHILHLEGSALSVNGRNVLAFETDPRLRHPTRPGRRRPDRWVVQHPAQWTRLGRDHHERSARRAAHEPADLRRPARSRCLERRPADPLNKTVKAKALVGLGSGEAFQLAFQGEGIVIVQPAEYAAPSAGA